MNDVSEFVGFMKSVAAVWPSGIDVSIRIGPQVSPPPVNETAADLVKARIESARLRESLRVANIDLGHLENHRTEDATLIRDQDDAIKAATERIVFLQKQILEVTNALGVAKQKAAQLSDLSVEQAGDLKKCRERGEELKAEIEEGRRALARVKGSLAHVLDACFCEDDGHPECGRCVAIRHIWEKL